MQGAWIAGRRLQADGRRRRARSSASVLLRRVLLRGRRCAPPSRSYRCTLHTPRRVQPARSHGRPCGHPLLPGRRPPPGTWQPGRRSSSWSNFMSPPGRSAMDRLTLMQRRGWTMEAIRLAAAKPVAHPDGRHDDFMTSSTDASKQTNGQRSFAKRCWWCMRTTTGRCSSLQKENSADLAEHVPSQLFGHGALACVSSEQKTSASTLLARWHG